MLGYLGDGMGAVSNPVRGHKSCDAHERSHRCSGGHLVHNDRHFALLHLRKGSVCADVLEQLLRLLGSYCQLYILHSQLTLHSVMTTSSEAISTDAHPDLICGAPLRKACYVSEI